MPILPPLRLLSDAPAPDARAPLPGYAPTPDADVGGRLFGRYRVVRAVGTGGFARVYHAIDPDLELDVAVKVLRPELAHDPEVVERFRREASTAAKLRHPHVITVLTVGRLTEPFDGIPAGAPYLVMDYLPHALAERLDGGGTLPEAEVARIGAEVARGLAYAHRQGIVHRDVKPENVLFARDGRAVVTDFGIARALSAPTGPSRQVLLGTPAYFSPEQARGLPLDGRSDLYALGVTLYRAATGVVPFAGDDWYVVMRQHIEDTPEPPSTVRRELDAGFDAVLARALAKDPAARFPTGDAMADALDRLRGVFVDRHNTTEVPALASAPAAPRVRGWRWVGAAAAAGAVAVVGGRVLAVRGSAERVPPGQLFAGAGAAPSASAVAELPSPNVLPDTPATAPAVTPATTPAAGRPPDSASRAGTTPTPKPGTTRRVGEATRSAAAPSAGARTTVPNGASNGRSASATGGRERGAAGSGAAKGPGTINVAVPATADVYLNGTLVGHGPWRSAGLPAGRYIVRASVSGLPGCPSADTAATVDLAGSARRTLTLQPIPCGRLILDITATNPAHYTLVPLRGGPTREGVLPLAQPLVLPDGTYQLTVEARSCADFQNPQVPVVAGTTRRESRTLICQ